MISLTELQPWELITLSGGMAVCALAVISLIGFTLAYLLVREPSAHGSPHVVAAPAAPAGGTTTPQPAMAAG